MDAIDRAIIKHNRALAKHLRQSQRNWERRLEHPHIVPVYPMVEGIGCPTCPRKYYLGCDKPTCELFLWYVKYGVREPPTELP